jgi:valyl-tRNA synthetase
MNVEQERGRLTAELADLDGQIARLERLLEGDFASRAPEQVVAREKERLARFLSSRSELVLRLESLKQ